MTSHQPSIEDLHGKAPAAAEFMRLFSTPSRLMLLCHIARKERSVSDIQQELGLKQPGLSQQLAELRQAGVVKTRRESRQIYYSIADKRVEAVMDLLLNLFCNGRRDTTPTVDQAFPVAATKPPDTSRPSYGEAALFARLDPAV